MESATGMAPAGDGGARAEFTTARCRTNSRRGLTDMSGSSYPPVEAACRVLDTLRTVNSLRIATVNDIHEATRIPKSSVVRMLETLMAQGYVTRDNMCGGYRVTQNVQHLSSGYDPFSEVIEIARPFAIDLTRRTNWPVGLGVPDGKAIAIKFWTGTISPWAHTKTVLGLRPDFYHSAMGRVYLAFCDDEERERRIADLRADPEVKLSRKQERVFRKIIDRARADGYATREPKTPPVRMFTIGLPLRDAYALRAVVSVSVYRTSVRVREFEERIIQPLKAATGEIEACLALKNSGDPASASYPDGLALAF